MDTHPQSNLSSSDPSWLFRLVGGLDRIVAAVVFHLIFAVLAFTDRGRGVVADWLFGMPVAWFLPLPGILVCVIGLVGEWRITTPEPSGLDAERMFSARVVARTLMLTAIIWCGVIVPLRLMVPLPVNAFLVKELGVVMAVLATVALLAHLRRLALRIPEEFLGLLISGRRLAFGARILSWIIVSLLVVIVPAMQPFQAWFGEATLASGGLVWVGVSLSIGLLILLVCQRSALRITAANTEARTGNLDESKGRGPGRREGRMVAGLACTVLAVTMGGAVFWSHRQISKLKARMHDEDPAVRKEAIRGFRPYGSAAVDPLVAAFRDESPDVREAVVRSNILTNHTGRAAVPALLALLNDPDARLRRWGSKPEPRLIRYGGGEPPVYGMRSSTPTLFQVLWHSQRFGSKLMENRELREALEAAREDEDEFVRFHATYPYNFGNDGGARQDALRKIRDGTGGKSLEFWIGHLEHDDPLVRQWAAFYVGSSKDKAAVPALVQLLQDGDANMQLWAASRFEVLGAGAEVAVLALVGLIQHEDELIQERAVEQLGRFGVEAASALVDALAHESRQVRSAAAYELQKAGRKGGLWSDPQLLQAAVPRLLEVSEDVVTATSILSYQIGPAVAAEAIGLIEPGTEEPVPALTKVLIDGDVESRVQAAQLLGLFRWKAVGAASALASVLADEDVGESAAKALGEIGYQALPKHALPDVLEAARSRNPKIRLRAVTGMSEIRHVSEEVIQVLVECLDCEDEAVVLAAVDALGLATYNLRAQDLLTGEALPRLVQFLEVEDRRLRTYSAHALLRMKWQEKEKALQVLIEALEYENARKRALVALSQCGSNGPLGPGGAEAVPALVEVVRSAGKNSHTRALALHALREIDPQAADEAAKLK